MRIDDYNNINYKEYEWKSGSMKFKAPSTWKEVSRDNSSITLLDDAEGRTMVVSFALKSSLKNEYGQILNAKEFGNYLYDISKKEPGVVMNGNDAKNIKRGKWAGVTFSYTATVEDEKYAHSVYVINAGEKYLVVQLSDDELTNGTRTKEIFNSILESIEC